jgi:hypothetical protein
MSRESQRVEIDETSMMRRGDYYEEGKKSGWAEEAFNPERNGAKPDVVGPAESIM